MIFEGNAKWHVCLVINMKCTISYSCTVCEQFFNFIPEQFMNVVQFHELYHLPFHIRAQFMNSSLTLLMNSSWVLFSFMNYTILFMNISLLFHQAGFPAECYHMCYHKKKFKHIFFIFISFERCICQISMITSQMLTF